MKRKVLIAVVALVSFVSLTSMTLGTSYHITDDKCGRCVINESSRKCGKCGNRMESHYLRQEGGVSSGIKIYYRADCTECNHSAYYYVE